MAVGSIDVNAKALILTAIRQGIQTARGSGLSSVTIRVDDDSMRILGADGVAALQAEVTPYIKGNLLVWLIVAPTKRATDV